MARRDSNDKKWQEVKKDVVLRDMNMCRLLAVLDLKEYAIYNKFAGRRFTKLDPAHVFAVSSYPHLCYELDNIVLLNRYSHTMLDSCKNPLDGTNISKAERDNWWKRIIGLELYEKLQYKN